MATYTDVIIFSLIGGIFSLIGGFLLISNKASARLLAKYATPFAAGALLAASFTDLLPEAIELTNEDVATRWMLGGVIIFFLLEHFLRWFHHHHEHGKEQLSQAPLIVIGDAIHNLLDGVAIGAAFLINVPTGIVASIAVAAHEIPQEIGDFGLLLKYGYSKRKVVIINVLSAVMSTVGAVITFAIGTQANVPLGALLAVTAGMFVYIAASDLIPAIHDTSKGKINYLAPLLLILGVLTISIANNVAHEFIDTAHTDEHEAACETPVNSDSAYECDHE